MLHLIHYGEREHIDQFFEDGSIQIGTVRSYDVETHGPMIGDDDEGLSFEYVTDENIGAHLRAGKQMPLGMLGMPLFLYPGSEGNLVVTTNQAFNYAIFCVSRILHSDLCKNFSPDYDAAIYIERPFPFFYELTKAFVESGLAPSVIFQHVADVHYRERIVRSEEELLEVFVKSPRYEHQAEVRAIWNVGHPTEKFYRFKAPLAARCCRKVLHVDMPSYEPGSLTPSQLENEIMRSLGIPR